MSIYKSKNLILNQFYPVNGVILLISMIFFNTPIINGQGKYRLKSLDNNYWGYQLTDHDELKELSRSNSYGVSHLKLQQYHQGYKVLGGQLIVHEFKETSTAKLTGSLVSNIELNTAKLLSGEELIDLAKIYSKDLILNNELITQARAIQCNTKGMNIIIDKEFPLKSGDFSLSQICTCSDNRLFSHLFYIDVHTGNLTLTVGMEDNISVPSTGTSNYYGEVFIDVDSISENQFVLRDLSRGQGIYVSDHQGRDFENNENKWDYTNQTGRAAVDVLFGSQKYYDFLLHNFDRNSIDDNGFPLLSSVGHINYANASWNGSRARFGLGNCHKYNSLTSLDIVGHEFTHGLIDFTAGLINFQESGALNEGMSDIFAKGLEHYVNPENFTWAIGGNIRINPLDNPIRVMNNPWSVGDPKFYKGENWIRDPPNHSYGTHTNAGVLNFWFTLIANGGVGINEVDQMYSIDSFGIEKALDLVYDVLTNYLIETSQYEGFSKAVLLSAEALFGAESQDYINTLNAINTVGLGDALTDNNEAKYDLNLECYPNSLCELGRLDYHDLRLMNNGKDIPENSIIEIISSIEIDTSSDNAPRAIYTLENKIDLVNGLRSGDSWDYLVEWDFFADPYYFVIIIDTMNIITPQDTFTLVNYNSHSHPTSGFSIQLINNLEINNYCDPLFDTEHYIKIRLPKCFPDLELYYKIENTLDSTIVDSFLIDIPHERSDWFYHFDVQDKIDYSDFIYDGFTSYLIGYLDGKEIFRDHHLEERGRQKSLLSQDSILIFQYLDSNSHNEDYLVLDPYYNIDNKTNFHGSLGEFGKIDSSYFSLNCYEVDNLFGHSYLFDHKYFKFCVDIGCLPNPVLQFKAKINHDISKSGFLQYFNYVDIKQGNESISTFFMEKNEYQLFEIPLIPDGASQISFDMYLDDVKISIKDVLFVDKSISFDNSIKSNYLITNPNSKLCKVTSLNGSIIDCLKVFDMQGRLIDTVNPRSNEYNLNVIKYAEGSYVIQLLSGCNIESSLLLKQ